MCLFKASDGEIKINNNSINQNIIDAYQNKISYVSQNIFLTNTSILENICLGEDVNNINKNKAIHALKISHLYDFVMSLPNNLYSYVGERGIQLSGGQKQRIAIARAIYFDKDILILDEATSSIDSNTEKKIMESIYNMKNKTIIMIAHRISTIKNCDKIFVLENGTIIDSGNFSDLSKKNKYLLDINNS